MFNTGFITGVIITNLIWIIGVIVYPHVYPLLEKIFNSKDEEEG